MLHGWVILLISSAYIGLLFAIAYYGDKRADAGRSRNPRRARTPERRQRSEVLCQASRGHRADRRNTEREEEAIEIDAASGCADRLTLTDGAGGHAELRPRAVVLACAAAWAGCAAEHLEVRRANELPSNPSAPTPLVERPTVLQATPAPAPPAKPRGPYVCPMHREVRSDAPGRCPKCGMALEQKEQP